MHRSINPEHYVRFDASMRNAYKRRGLPCWVPPSDMYSLLRRHSFSCEIAYELSEWMARKFSMWFVAGYRSLQMPARDHHSEVRMLERMNYHPLRAAGLLAFLDDLPRLYAKGAQISATERGATCKSAREVCNLALRS
jgi:hypothetical protein